MEQFLLFTIEKKSNLYNVQKNKHGEIISPLLERSITMKTKSMAVFILLVYSTFTVAGITQLCNLNVETSKYTNQWVETLASGTDRFFHPVEAAPVAAQCFGHRHVTT